ncbi:MAG: hypothetical protein IKM17_05440 [Lentisphaeria bacterium]|nr:hypothetical protein [Lentisphaeria bacterium]
MKLAVQSFSPVPSFLCNARFFSAHLQEQVSIRRSEQLHPRWLQQFAAGYSDRLQFDSSINPDPLFCAEQTASSVPVV